MKKGWTEEARQNRAELSRKQQLERYSDPEERRKHSLRVSEWWKNHHGGALLAKTHLISTP
jgi:hypothetical protein